MRALLFLFCIAVCSNAFAKKIMPEEQTDISITGNWQVTSTHYTKTGYRNIVLMLKSDNDILGNDPENPQPLPLTLSLACAKEQVKKKPVLSILYPNILFPTTTHDIQAVMDETPLDNMTGTISKETMGNNTGSLITFNEATTRRFIMALAPHRALRLKLDFDKTGNFDGKFTIDQADNALAAVKKYCMDE